tara:strand:+ start:3312 stop:4235 length:924 start_codon:yes stop_codon:yes gene_type:complete
MKRIPIVILILFFSMQIPNASASIQDVEMRLDTAIQYPNDRPVNIVVEGMAFQNDKPSMSNIDIVAEVRFANGTLMFEQQSTVSPGIRTSITFPAIEEVGRYYVYTYGEAGGIRSGTESQTMRITYAPQTYTAGFTDGGRFIVSPLQEYVNLTIQELRDSGNALEPGNTYFTNGSYLDIDVPDGYLAVRYTISDENGWMNYERADSTGLTVHGTPYVWIYGDLSRVEPVSSLVSPAGIIIAIIGGMMILIGLFNFYNKFRDESLIRRKKAGTDGMPGWRERRNEQKIRKAQEERYWNERRHNQYRRY